VFIGLGEVLDIFLGNLFFIGARALADTSHQRRGVGLEIDHKVRVGDLGGEVSFDLVVEPHLELRKVDIREKSCPSRRYSP